MTPPPRPPPAVPDIWGGRELVYTQHPGDQSAVPAGSAQIWGVWRVFSWQLREDGEGMAFTSPTPHLHRRRWRCGCVMQENLKLTETPGVSPRRAGGRSPDTPVSLLLWEAPLTNIASSFSSTNRWRLSATLFTSTCVL